MGRYFLKCVPLGFVLNRIKTPSKFTEAFVKDLEDLLEIPCVAQIREDPKVSKSYGGVGSDKAFLAYDKIRENEFKTSIDEIAGLLLGRLPEPEKRDVVDFIEEVIKQRSRL